MIVRPPLESALAHMARRDIAARPTLVSWIRFHRRILPFRHGFVAVSFADMTSDFGAVTERVNAAFGTSFGVFDHTPENEAAVFAEIERRNRSRWGDQMTPERARALARPTAERSALKQRLRAQLEVDELAGLRAQAEGLYRTLVASRSGRPDPDRGFRPHAGPPIAWFGGGAVGVLLMFGASWVEITAPGGQAGPG